MVSDDLSSMRMDYALVAGRCLELTFGSGILTRQ